MLTHLNKILWVKLSTYHIFILLGKKRGKTLTGIQGTLTLMEEGENSVKWWLKKDKPKMLTQCLRKSILWEKVANIITLSRVAKHNKCWSLSIVFTVRSRGWILIMLSE